MNVRNLSCAVLGLVASFFAIGQVVDPGDGTGDGMPTNTFFGITIAPTNTSVMITETTNSVFVTITNLVNFTNILVSGSISSETNVVEFSDNGQRPDLQIGDGVFSGEFLTPSTFTSTEVTLSLTLIGEDLTVLTNSPPPVDPVFVTNMISVVYRVVSPPGNDDFTNAFKFASAGGVITSTNNFATMEELEPIHARVNSVAASVWWNWSSGFDGPVLVDSAGSDFPAVLAVYTGKELSALELIGASERDTVNDLPSNVQFEAVRGLTYRIAVAGTDNTTNGVGNVRLRIARNGTPDSRPPNVVISDPQRDALITTELLTLSGFARETLITDSGVNEVFVQVNDFPATNVTTVAANGEWFSQVEVPAGTNIVSAIAIDFAGNQSIADSIVVRFINPTNDIFVDRTLLSGASGFVNAINGRASLEMGEPLHAGNEGGRSIWYSWRAPANGRLQLSTIGSSFDTLLGVYSGEALAELQEIVSNDDVQPGIETSELSLLVLSNGVYQISVDGFGADSGDVFLDYAFFSDVEVDEFFSLSVANASGGVVSPQNGVFPIFSRVTLTALPEPNFQFLRWEGDIEVTDNPLSLTMAANLNLRPVFEPAVFTDSFESGDLAALPWATFQETGWFVQTNVTARESRYAVRSGLIKHGGKSSLSLLTEMGNGTASFDLIVGAESNWDYLEFRLDDLLLRRWSGEQEVTYFFPVTSGTHKLEWLYVKDGSFTGGFDGAVIDNFYIPTLEARVVNAPELTILSFPEGAQISISGLPNQLYEIQASDDLEKWTTIQTKSSVSGVVHILDVQAANLSTRYYRAVAK